jgi:poly-gamma-glutamate capsule biosynthesis protein CapA/YwtB (metallophosphatase superfamily)
MADDKVLFYAMGDRAARREDWKEQMKYIVPVHQEADIRYCQFEGVISDKGTYQLGSGPPTYRVPPTRIAALKNEGYDLVSPNGNHLQEWGYEAVLDCIEHLEKNDIRALGIGKNLEEARKPVILERKGTKIAFLAYNSIKLRPGWAATAKNPGFVPITVYTYYEPAEPDQPGTPVWIHTFCNRKDLALMQEDIRKAKEVADVVVVCPHMGIHFVRAAIAEYQFDLTHAAIDAGADVIIGTHNHLLKGVEVYKGKVIFYSLGNYAFDTVMDPVTQKPEKPLLHSPGLKLFIDLYKLEYDPEYPYNELFGPEGLRTGIAKIVIENKKVQKVSFIPVLTNKMGQLIKQTAGSEGWDLVINYLRDITKEAKIDTEFKAEGDELIIVA